MTANNRYIFVLLKIYVTIVLIVVTILSPLNLSFVPILLLMWYLFFWRCWPFNTNINLLTECFIFFAITLLLSPHIGYLFSLLVSLPVLILIDRNLKNMATRSMVYRDAKYNRSLTNVGRALLTIIVLVMGASLLLGSLPLILACTVIIIYLISVITVILRGLPIKPVEENQVQQRVLAGSEGNVHVELNNRTKYGGLLFIESPYEWLKITPAISSLKENRLVITVSLTPMLSGPSLIKLKGYATDYWGLTQTRFEIEPIRLHVIPRARYAAWLANKYMSSTKPGNLPIISNLEAIKPVSGLRRGIEYYGSQMYQPGDSLKNIDWKHSFKYNELISKEFLEFQGRPAILLINLAAKNEEELDKLGYNIIVSAISLAQNNIPVALAVYDHEGVKMTTPLLHSNELMLKTLQVTRELVIFTDPLKYLSTVDIGRLRSNMHRLGPVENQASQVLTELLQLEYRNLNNSARLNPASKALLEVFRKADKQSDIVIISQCNHDAEALSFNAFQLVQKGNTIIYV